MTIPAIPADFIPQSNSYKIDAPGGVMRTEVAGGAPRYALDYDRGTQRFNVNLILSAFQFQVWSAFFHYTIKKGAITFSMKLDSGTGLVDHNCNIVPGSYSAASMGTGIMSITFMTEAESAVYSLGSDGAQALVDSYAIAGSGTPALLARIAKFATVDTLVLHP